MLLGVGLDSVAAAAVADAAAAVGTAGRLRIGLGVFVVGLERDTLRLGNS